MLALLLMAVAAPVDEAALLARLEETARAPLEKKEKVAALAELAASAPASGRVNLKAAELLNGLEASNEALTAAGRSLAVKATPAGYVQSGTARFGLADYAGATRDCRAALKLSPRYFPAFALCKMAEDRSATSGKAEETPASVEPEFGKPSAAASGASAQNGFSYSKPSARRGAAHPTTAWDVVQPAMKMLRSSESGRMVEDSLKRHRVQFAFKDLPPGTDAQYDRDLKTIFVPTSIVNAHPVEMGVTVGHEGFHVVQHLDRGMAISLEGDQEAAMRHVIIYHELLMAGEPRLPRTSGVSRDYELFRTQGVDALYLDVKTRYLKARGKQIEREIHGLPPAAQPIARPVIWAIAEAMNLVPGALSISRQRFKLRFFDKNLSRSAKVHAAERAWEDQWVLRHQNEF